MKTASSGETRALAAFAAGLRYEALPANTVSMTKRLLLDGLACLIVGTRGGPGKSAAATMRRLGGLPQATVFSGGFRTSVRDAAFANGITLYSVGLNDIHKPSSSHPGGCIVPVVLSMGEWRSSHGRDLIAGMVAGYEINGRIGSAIAPSHRARGFHPTGTCGTFGAAATAGRLLGLDAETLASVFGLAGSQAAGLYEFHYDGTLTMVFHAGRAAQNGVEACLMVQDGLSGPATIIEGSQGFSRAVANEFNSDKLVRDLGKIFMIDETSFRPYYGCSSTIAASDAMARMLKEIDRDKIKDLEVRCHPIVAHDNNTPDPTTLLGARLSMQYNMALVMDRGEVMTADLTEEDLWKPDLRARMATVRLTPDDRVPRFGAILIGTDADGSRHETANLTPRGDASAPLTFEDVCVKFRQMTRPICNDEAIEAIIEIVDKLEHATGPDLVRSIVAALPQTAG